MIKPIQTRYNGYFFRSRLEARWGVFFDALGIKYEYEPEGFETPHGWYLPDFRIKPNHHKIYIEIKSYDFKFVKSQDDVFKIASLKGFLIAGDPLECIFHSYTSDFGYKFFSTDSIASRMLFNCTVSEYRKAAKKARSARFEHGETPT